MKERKILNKFYKPSGNGILFNPEMTATFLNYFYFPRNSYFIIKIEKAELKKTRVQNQLKWITTGQLNTSSSEPPHTIVLIFFTFKGGFHSFDDKLTRLKIIPDRGIPMALLF